MNRKKIDFKTENKDKRDGLIDLMKQVTQKFGFTLGTFALGLALSIFCISLD